MAVIEGVIEILLDVEASALGSSLTSRIAGQDVQVRLPRRPGVGSSSNELHQPAFEHVSAGVSLDPWVRDSPAWGKWYLRDGEGGAAAIRRVGLVVSVPDESLKEERQAMAAALYEAVDDWRSLVGDWLEVVFGQTLRLPSSRERPGQAIAPWLWSHDGGSRVLLHNQGPLTALGSRGDKAVDAQTLQQVCTAAGKEHTPPLAWLLTRNARHQHSRGEHRGAVLDAGTAAELALSKVLLERQVNLGDVQTLGSLVGLAQNPKHGVPCPTDAKDALVCVRNDAAHRGRRPTSTEVTRALQISEGFVHFADPRSALLH